MTGMLAPVFQDVTDGYAEVREIFRLPRGDRSPASTSSTARSTRNDTGARAAQRRGGP